MGLFRFLSGKSPELHEERGDEYAASGSYGDARIEYEKALSKIEKKFPEKAHLEPRFREKYHAAGEHLARTHMDDADALAGIGDYEEARQLYHLSLELTNDHDLEAMVKEKLRIMEDREMQPSDVQDMPSDTEEPEAGYLMEEDGSEDEMFSVLCHALPEETAEAYMAYGEMFKSGYIALNRGDFQQAVEYLAAAMEENPGASNFIALELATAYMHMEEYGKAQDLLESFVGVHPDEVRAYQLLCELYWEEGDYDKVEHLIENAPSELQHSKVLLLLLGENRFQETSYVEAENYFRRYILRHGSDEIVSRALAKTLEAKGDIDSAREMYAESINKCASCGTRVDPFLKRRYAELCFQSDQFSPKLLELYLSLAQEDPDHRPVYYQRISKIYEKLGENSEARRYEAFAEGRR